MKDHYFVRFRTLTGQRDLITNGIRAGVARGEVSRIVLGQSDVLGTTD